MADELRADGDALALHLEREYAATADEVWSAWTDPDRLARWLAPVSGALRPGSAPVRLTFGDGDDDRADLTVLTAEAPRLLRLRWAVAGAEDSEVRVEIVPLAAGRVRLVLDHRRLGDATIGYGAGWEAYLRQLPGELGIPQDASWDELFAAALPAWRERAVG